LDFQDNPYTPRAAPWPITYAELEPYYERAEQTLGVRGGILSTYHPPRKSILSPSSRPNNATLKVMLHEVGITVDNSPESAKGYDGECVRVARDMLPYFSNERDGLLICGGTVTRLLPDSTGYIDGAIVESFDGGKKLLRARIYVIACGGLETARLLLLSRCRFFPEGIGNRSGVVGRHFMEHVKITYHGHIPRRDFSGYARCHQFYESLKHQGFGSVILAFGSQRLGGQYGLRISADIEMVPSETNRVSLADDLKDHFGNPGVDLSLNLTEQDIETIEQVRSLIHRIYADLGAQDVVETVEDGSAITWLHHHMGSCRMGDNPKTSVTDRNLRVHQSPNLYVAGSSVFVTSGASNPTLTIAALSHRLADHLVARLQCLPSKEHATRSPALPTRSRDGQIDDAAKGYA
jgi:choline dehydrogenase-like flavoprotein